MVGPPLNGAIYPLIGARLVLPLAMCLLARADVIPVSPPPMPYDGDGELLAESAPAGGTPLGIEPFSTILVVALVSAVAAIVLSALGFLPRASATTDQSEPLT
jgi:hypothetical protein